MIETQPPPLRLEAYRDLSARRTALAARLADMDPDDAVVAIETILVAAADRPQQSPATTLGLASWLVRQHQANALTALFECARAHELTLSTCVLEQRGDDRALPRLGRLPEGRVGTYAPLTFPLSASFVALSHGEGGYASLHHAMRWQPHLYHQVPRLCDHPDPVFIRRLLDAPWVRRPEVMRVAARRPTISGIAYAVATHDRWLVDPLVRTALLENPFTPTGLRLSLLPLASADTLHRLSQHGPLTTAARAFLTRRHHV